MTDETVERVERACAKLIEDAKTVSFINVAARSGMSRATLYRRPELRALVEEHRMRERDAHTLSGLATELQHLHRSVESLAAKVRRHEETLRRLKPKRG